MFHACATRFDVIENLVKFWFFSVSKQGLRLAPHSDFRAAVALKPKYFLRFFVT